MVQLTELYIYPVKSMAGIRLQKSKVDALGLQYDRRWMVVTPKGHFMTQRMHPQMALIQPRIDADGHLTLHHPEHDDLRVPGITDDSPRKSVRVWEDYVEAVSLGDAVDAWVSAAIEEDCHLVYFADDVHRQCDLRYAKAGDKTGFADGFPLLLIGEGSLNDLNARLEEPVEMRRFRPNVVVSSQSAFAEDEWHRIQIGDMTFRVVKPCSRCKITTVDPDTGQRTGADPLKTLSSYRKQGNAVMFGQNVIQDGQGELEIGMAVTILD